MPADAAARRGPAVAVRAATRVPFAVSLVAMLLATTVWTRMHPADTQAAYAWVSTNIHNLSTAPLRSLVLSALFLPDQRWLFNAAVLLAVAVPLERRIGSLRTLAVFASAHVGGTVLTEGYEWLAVHVGALPASVAFQEDVGVSYGLYGLAAAACALVPGRARYLAAAGVGLYVGVPLALDPGMTTTGHVLCWAIGLAWWPYLLRAGIRRRDPEVSAHKS